MRVPEEVRKSVVYLGRLVDEGSQRRLHFCGTGFIAIVDSAKDYGQKRQYLHLVTARHVVEQLKLGKWVMRINTKNGKFADVEVEQDVQWWFHPTENDRVDAAVMPIGIGQEFDCIAVPETAFLSDARIHEMDIGGGDEVFITGLFNRARGHSRNMPIVRMGNVSLIPDPGELIPGIKICGRPTDSEVYLIEARSVGGLSGSPVFVRCTVTAKTNITNEITGQTRSMYCRYVGEFYLLGLVHGHWDIPVGEINDSDPRVGVGQERVNIGIAVVVPAKKILEIIYHPELVEIRKRRDEEHQRQQGTTTPD